jgi:DNA-binding NarL/FixJ family response regulator
MKPRRILLADDEVFVSEGLRAILEPAFEIVGIVQDGHALLERAQALRPDLIVLDIALPVLNGIDAARLLRKSLPRTRLVYLTRYGDSAFAIEAFRAGASGYVLKRCAASELVSAIENALTGRMYVTPLVATDEVRSEMEGRAAPRRSPKEGASAQLTPREREVLQLVAEGKSNKEIAGMLDISVKTVEFHKSRIMQRLGIRTTAGLTRYAIVHGIVSQ